MLVHKAYDVTDVVSARSKLSSEQIQNIELVIKMVLDNLPATKVFYQVPLNREHDNYHPVVRYNKNVFNKKFLNDNNISAELDYLANKLLFEEQVEDNDGSRRRNKKIKEGLLFAKHTKDSLVLLKFEETKIIDKTTFRPIDGLSIDKQYYKIVVINKNVYKDIMIVDRNKVVAKYWAGGFLELERQRDAFVNTSDLLIFLEEDNLINKSIGFTEEEYKDLKQQVREILFDSKTFDKDDLFSSLIIDSKTYQLNSEDLFDDNVFKVIDSEFRLDKDVIIKKYSKKIKISDSVTIMVENLNNEMRRENIELDGNILTLTIDSKYRQNVKEIIEEGKGNG
ncbi:hypothetical protein EY693_10290 [Enterococcus casseliflavus]|uniref:hypothetical protein n=1 Tax=Enterococcus casseliflavus TaxID=37734 RepID=UPI00115DB004|nr:hypothetical protein [Enterococcus casseliflavus]MBO6356711.1 hypothetical protein [Enterococcus casseliflavus]MBO6376720.1 hypothetical protein [Enterococcus casseliflavus]